MVVGTGDMGGHTQTLRLAQEGLDIHGGEVIHHLRIVGLALMAEAALGIAPENEATDFEIAELRRTNRHGYSFPEQQAGVVFPRRAGFPLVKATAAGASGLPWPTSQA